MKKLLTISLLMITIVCVSQNFNGVYTSSQTSFNDTKNSKNNFTEKTLFNITITYDSTKKSNNYILIQDPRLPSKVLTYNIQKKLVKMPSSQYTNSSYVFKDCINVNTKIVTDVVIYYNKQNELNLMVSDENNSQAFKKLVKAK